MPVAFKDYYSVLGVSRDSTPDEIKKAFRKLARKFHPDVAKDNPQAEDKFKEINEAHEVLGDPEKRGKYDRLGASWNDSGEQAPQQAGNPPSPDSEFHFEGTGFSDFFEQYFSGATRYGFPGGGHADFKAAPPFQEDQARRGSDVEGDILVTLEEALHGTIRPLSLRMLNRRTGAAETRSFQVRIPPGATDGRRIRVKGEGESGRNGGPDGDLYLMVRHAAHPEFTSRGTEIHHELEIAPWEAVLGSEAVVPGLGGSIKLRIPAGSQHDQRLRVRGRGLPKGTTGERGDYFVILKVSLPTDLGEEERLLWEKLRDASSFRPRSHKDSKSNAS